jgi:hypothetical protein
MTEYVVGGRRRIDRVLAPDFLHDLDGLDIEELRARRAEADQEETDLSYARRLLQGRLDILQAERAARDSGEPGLTGPGDGGAPPSDAELAERLARILADGPRRSTGLGRHLGRNLRRASPSRVGENRREAERAVADVGGSDLAHLTDAELTGALEHLQDVEGRLSRSRREVQQVVDTLTSEIARRYQAGQVPITLP